MINIHNLTKEQCEMLDKIWHIDTEEELMAFRSTLPRFRRQQLDTLIQLLVMEDIEENMNNETWVAKAMLAGIGVKCS